jgi:hypothetical protein
MSYSSPQPSGQSGHWLLPGGAQPEDIDALASFSRAITHDGSTGCWGTVQCECPFNLTYDDPVEWEQRVYDCLWRQNGFPLEPPLDADILPSSQLSSAAKGEEHGERGISDEQGLHTGGEDQEEGDISDDEVYQEGCKDQEDEEDGDFERGSELSEDNEDRTDDDYLEDGQEEIPATSCAGEAHDNAEEHENSERCKIANPPSSGNPKNEAVQSTGPAQPQPEQPDPEVVAYLLNINRGDWKRTQAYCKRIFGIQVSIPGSKSDTKASGAGSPVPPARDVKHQERPLPPAPRVSSSHKFQGNFRSGQNTFMQCSTKVLHQKKRRSTSDEDVDSDAYQPASKRAKSHEGPTSMLSTSCKTQSSAQSYPQSYSQGPFQGNPQGTCQGSSHSTPYLSSPHNNIDLSNKRNRISDVKDEVDDDVDQRPIKKAKSTTTVPGPREANSSAADKPSRKKGQSWSDDEGAALHQLVVEQQELEKRENLKPMRDERLFEKLAPQLQQRMGANGKSRSPLACKNYWNRIGRARFNCENRGETKRSDTLVTSAQASKAQKATQQGKIKQQTKQKSKSKAEESDEDAYEE